MRGDNGPAQPPAAMVTLHNLVDERYWSSFDNDTVKAVSFGLVATAFLISMFLVMAIFERLFRRANGRPSPSSPSGSWDVDSRLRFANHPKIWEASPKIMSPCANGMTVLMSGEDVPTFVAQPSPLLPCPQEPMISRTLHPNKFNSFGTNF